MAISKMETRFEKSSTGIYNSSTKVTTGRALFWPGSSNASTNKLSNGRVEAVLFANISFGMLEHFKPLLKSNNKDSLTIGSVKDLPHTIGDALKIETMDELCRLIKECYPEFRTISDATPIGAEAEAVKIRMVTHQDKRIIEPLVDLKLFKHKLLGLNVANKLLDVIIDKCGLDPKD